MHKLTIIEQISALRTKKFSSVELVNHYIQRIDQQKDLNAFISLNPDFALTMAKKSDKLLATGKSPILCGIPMAHKDMFCTENLPTTCGSKILKNFIAPYNATIVERLNENHAITLGKTNLDEFGMGSSGENSYYGPALNPWNKNHVPGGSSSGSAAAVAARIIPFATTTDTGGSGRQPASFCNLSNIKTTYGLTSRNGQVAYASSFDQAGALTTNIPDLALITQIIAGFDNKDSTTINKPLPNFSEFLETPITAIKIGLPVSLLESNVDTSVKKVVLETAKAFEHLGAKIIEIDLNLIHTWLPCYGIIACAEASANLARYDGIRFGLQAPNVQNIEELITKSRTEGFGQEVKKRILTGTFVLSNSQYEQSYLQAQKVRQLITNELTEKLQTVQSILMPTTPSEAFKLGESKINSLKYQLGDMFTVCANLSGLPAIAFPAGFGNNNLPIGVQLLGNYLSEPQLFQLANAFQKNTHWHTKFPDLGESE